MTNVTRHKKYRILLAAPTILYFPIYLAWIMSAESIQERVEFWVPDGKNGTNDRLMIELFNDSGANDILFCVGDLLRAYEYLKRENNLADNWSQRVYSRTFINKLPMAAYKIIDDDASGAPVYMCHRSPMTSFEIAEYLAAENAEIKLFSHVSAGHERLYINSVYDYISRNKVRGRRRPIYLIAPEVFAGGAFDRPVEKDMNITQRIQEMQRGEKDKRNFLLTSIMNGNSGNPALETYFFEKISAAVDLTKSDPEKAAYIFYQNIDLLNEFGNTRPRELTEVVCRLSASYEVDSKITTAFRNGITAAARVRYGVRCKDHRPSKDCGNCQEVASARLPFMWPKRLQS